MFLEHSWSPDEWPDHIVNSFMDFKYSDHICVCNFLFFGNGMKMDDAFSAISFHHS